MRRIVFVWFPRWSTDRFCRNMERVERNRQANSFTAESKSASLREQPFALTHSVAGGMRIAALNAAAEHAGVQKDQLLADARALCPDIMLAGADVEADKKALTGIADWLGRYTPWTAPSHRSSGVHNGPPNGPYGVFLDITGCAHLFARKSGDGEERLLDDMMIRLAEFGYEARAGLADAPGAAWAIAHFARLDGKRFHIVPSGGEEAAIAHLPVAALRLDSEICRSLDAMGLKKISQLTGLPRAPLTARFGTDVAHRLDQALGEDEEPISPGKVLVPYRIRKILVEPITRLEDISEGVARLASDLEARFLLDRKGARRLVLTLYRVDGHVMRLKVGTAEVTADPAHITRLFTEKLDRITQDFDAGFGIDVMALAATVVEDKVPMQITLKGVECALEPARESKKTRKAGSHPRFSGELSALLDRLGNRLGPREVYQMAPNPSHIPERAVIRRPVMSVADKGLDAWPDVSQGEMIHALAHAPERPLTMLERAEPVEVLAEVPDGPPKRFRWRKVTYHIVKTLGPERIAPEWWRSADLAGSTNRTRDYFQAEDRNGRRFWLFRNGLYERETNAPEWFVHGVFG